MGTPIFFAEDFDSTSKATCDLYFSRLFNDAMVALLYYNTVNKN